MSVQPNDQDLPGITVVVSPLIALMMIEFSDGATRKFVPQYVRGSGA
ncbi:MAG: hypothetical protein JWN94_4408 [Betaproteobacteria bacterium]|nr:hypothetical protein [Betaproteobacteria bacterium]